MDKSAVLLMSDEQLASMGVSTIGDRLRLKAFCSSGASTSRGPDSSADKQAKIDRVKALLQQSKRDKKSNANSDSSSSASKARKKETLKLDFGWKHWSNGKYKQKRSDRGGGKRRIDVSRDAGYDECLRIAKKLFFPRGLSSEGPEDDMHFVLANYADLPVNDLGDDSESMPFSAGKYKEITGFTLPSIYLLSRSLLSDDDNASDDSLHESVFRDTRPNPVDDDNAHFLQSSMLIGTSSERKAFFEDLKEQLAKSEADDKAKHSTKEAEERKQRELMEQEIAKAQEEADALNTLRKARERRIPPQPTENGVVVSVRHVDLGVLTRSFPSSATMSAVYDWVGSLSPTPKHFRLTKMPNFTLYPDASVSVADRELLSMSEEGFPLPLALDENEVNFFEGESAEPKTYADATLLDVSPKPPEVLFESDEETHTTEISTHASYASLEERRIQGLSALEKHHEKVLTISRHNITELMSVYQDPEVGKQKLVVLFDEDSGSGDGVVREMFSLFWEQFVLLNCEGSSQFTISVSPAMRPDDYATVGRILTHGFLLCGSFPLQLARASLHQTIFGSVDDDCLLDSFLMLLPQKERETILIGLEGTKQFPSEAIMDILDDFKETTIPLSSNLRKLLLKVATAEFITKPFLPFLKLREGMGEFWNALTRDELDSLYQMCCPTPEKVAGHLHAIPSNPQEETVFRWVKRYVRNLDTKMAVKFVRFCTASDVLLPDKGIVVRFENMVEEAIRPTAHTCFRALDVARNYRSFNHLRDNFDFYLRDSGHWDFSE